MAWAAPWSATRSKHSARGYTRFRVDVSADNVPAIRVYEGVGLRAFATGKSPEAALEYRAMALG